MRAERIMSALWGSAMSGFDLGSVTAGAAAAVCWFLSARVRLTKIKAGLEELDKVAQLSKTLQKMAVWNFWAAAWTCAAVSFQVLAKVF